MSSVATVTIDRKERRNAIDVATCVRLTDELRAAAAGGARVLVLTGAGEHFCAGADLSLIFGTELSAAIRELLNAITGLPIPVIAAVRGAALGAGTQVAMACDLRVVEPTTRFGIPAAKLGVMVDEWTVRRLSQLAGPGPARAVLLAGDELDAEAALRLGFAHRAGDLAAAQAWAAGIARLAPLSVQGHKQMLNEVEGVPSLPGAGAAAYERAWASADAREGLAAFRERRRPEFGGA